MELKEAIEILLTMRKQFYTAQAIDTVLHALEELQKENTELKSELQKRDATYYHVEACRKEIENIRLIRESFEQGKKLESLINNIDYTSYLGKERIKEDIKKLEQEKQNKCCYLQEEIEMKIKSSKKLLREE